MKTKQIIWTIIFLMILPASVSGQYKKMLDVLEDTETETIEGKLTLRFFDAKTADPVSDAQVSIPNVGEFTSDLGGKVLFDKQKDGKYTFSFSKKDYVTAVYEFEIIAETIFFNRFSVCPKTELGALRIVLDWDRSPADLDLHLVKEDGYHISYHNTIASSDGSAQLDRDDRDGYGAETITINKTDNQAIYACYVHDYSDRSKNNSKNLSRSKAVVRVYNNNELTDTFYVPRDDAGNKWSVFQIHNGQVDGIMRVSDGN
ncbi:MAG: hypothetical protein PHS84_10555 [Paludibacter sp.]|nr:hypothetical protein [Paludibacter sp.]